MVEEELDIQTRQRSKCVAYCTKKAYEEGVGKGRMPEKDKVEKAKRRLRGETKDAWSLMEGDKDVYETEVVYHVKLRKVTNQCNSSQSISLTQESDVFKDQESHLWKTEVLARLPKIVWKSDLEAKIKAALQGAETVVGTAIATQHEEDEAAERARAQLLAAEASNIIGSIASPDSASKGSKLAKRQSANPDNKHEA